MVFKIEKNKNYTVMSNHHLRDKNLSLKAKGLLSFMLSLPEDWDYSLNGLVSVSKESKKAIRSILNELKENGYLVVEQTRGEKGQYKYNYIIYEEPLDIKKEKSHPDTQKGNTVEGDTEKDTQINTNKQNTDKKIDKIDKTIHHEEKNNFKSSKKKKTHILTKDIIKRKYIKSNDIEQGKYDKFFKGLLEEYDLDDVVTILHYVIKSVKSREFRDENGKKINNRFGYLKKSILENIDKFKNNEIEWDEELGWFRETVDISNLYEQDKELDYDY